MKSLFALALVCVALSGCSEKSHVEEKVVTPGGTTTTEVDVKKTGDHKTP